MVNGNVESCLRGGHESQPPLNWPIRKGIALGVAKGLAHLHYECDKKIIHHNVNAATIMLDEDFEAVVGDFELAMIMDHNITFYRSTSIVGTIAYGIAHDYPVRGYRWSVRSDVLCYGLFLLELIAGQSIFDLARLANDDDETFLDWVIKRNYKERKWEMLVDADSGGYMEDVVELLVQIALLCTQSNPTERPKMSEVVSMLEAGDGLAERWEEWYKKEAEKESDSSHSHIRIRVNNNAFGFITRELFSAWYQRRKPKDKYLVDFPEDLGILLALEHIRCFSLHELQAATENFSSKIVDEDGYNMVYKGGFTDGSRVAVKRFKGRGGSQTAEVQFQKEVEINRIAAHPNVLHVLGFCITSKEWFLVFPLMVNGSAASCLRGRHESQPPLNWPTRKEIALGAARGLAHLHDECDKKIIHRDVKAANILLDNDYEAVVADFELAIIGEHNVTDFVDAIRGTIGHIAPEYLSTGLCSEKTDVFSYGMFLLELITGQRASDLAWRANHEHLGTLDWVKRNYKERKWATLVDADCGGNYMEDVVEQLMQIALLCTQYTPEGRPKMSEVVRMLEDRDGLVERWEEWYKNGVEKETEDSKNHRYLEWIIDDDDDDDTFNLAPEELSGPR